LKSWEMLLAARGGMRKAKVALARKLAVVLHRTLAIPPISPAATVCLDIFSPALGIGM
jgi:transposase